MAELAYPREAYSSMLGSIDLSTYDYNGMLKIGMGAKAAGLPFEEFGEKMRAALGDSYDEGTTRAKWDGFDEDGGTGPGSLWYEADKHGWKWDGPGPEAPRGAKQAPPASAADRFPRLRGLSDPGAWDNPFPQNATPQQMQAVYLGALFMAHECVNVVTEHGEGKGGKPYPLGRGTTYDAGALAYRVSDAEEPFDPVASADPQAGAWARVNPVSPTGSGQNGAYRDADVTAYRHALVECDGLPIEEQARLIRALRLPCAAVVSSGGKSLHAVVRVDARDAGEFADRVGFLYGVCEANGLAVDPACRNPSRFTRFPGARRGDQVQSLLATNQGEESWAAWRSWVWEHERARDGYEVVSVGQITGPNVLPQGRELIRGLLREGYKANITGASKAGKSWCATELAYALALGGEWMGKFRCEACRVLYVNTEITEGDMSVRFEHVRKALGAPQDVPSLGVLNRRGMSNRLEELAEELGRRARGGERWDAVIIDPIYKYLEGRDENSAGDVGEVCREMDAIAALGTAVVYVHHHAKGLAGGRSAIDRGSGSGVWARDPDLLIDLTALDTEGRDDLPAGLSAHRVNVTARSFPPVPPFAVEFRFPLHVPRPDLDGLSEAGSPEAARERGGRANARRCNEDKEAKAACLAEAVRACVERGETPTRANVLEGLNERLAEAGFREISRDTLNDWTSTRNKWCGYAPNTAEGNALQRVARYKPDGLHEFYAHYPWEADPWNAGPARPDAA